MNFEIQSTFNMNIRKKIIVWLFEKSQRAYTYFKRKTPWKVTRTDLLKYPEASFGKYLGLFLLENGFELIPKVERHDAYHVLTGYGTEVQDEIALQYLCFGNGKRSLYLFGVILLGTLLLPDYMKYYRASFKKGRRAHSFHQYNYEQFLDIPLNDLRQIFFNPYKISFYDTHSL